ncbi:peptidoglycan/xylan/chitin deacetylase (PgdA/CDA1 family) [Sphingomonas zeicaulis]|uniref:polysaccharide deacetylase family protein n=1 Tax=Sphingomonas zeicaulis TaxID=1632740 RepID=UPI003D1F68E7
MLAVTIDDLPVHGPLPPGETPIGIARATIAALKDAHVPATGFVNGANVEPGSAEVLAAWKAAGLPLGDHTFNHRGLSKVGAAAFIAEIDANASFLLSQPKRFRYPFLDEGEQLEDRDEVRAALAERGYKIAAVTMSFADFAYNVPYARCVTQGNEAAIADLESRYLDAARADAARARFNAKTVARREVPQVLLLHIGAFGARMLPRLLEQYRALGFRFVTLDEAQHDPFYAATDPALPGPTASLMMAPPVTSGVPDQPATPGDELCPQP